MVMLTREKKEEGGPAILREVNSMQEEKTSWCKNKCCQLSTRTADKFSRDVSCCAEMCVQCNLTLSGRALDAALGGKTS